jgi:hypothetical protein
MCPIADMVNHNEASAPAFRWNEEEEVFELFSPVSVPRGGEVSISYGEVNNAHLLHYYGFIPGSNVFNSVPITEHEIQAAARELDSQQVRSFFSNQLLHEPRAHCFFTNHAHTANLSKPSRIT